MPDVRGGGFWSRAGAIYPPGQVPSVDALEAALRRDFGDRYQIYRTKLLGADLVAKRSGWTGLTFKVKKDRVAFGPFAPSAGVRLLFMGLIPMVIMWFKSWKAALHEFKTWFAEDGPTRAASGDGAPRRG
jgi:hypothetical protein